MSGSAEAQRPYRFEMSSTTLDEDWDHFVEQAAGGSHRQCSRWAQLKAFQGWEASRLLIRRDGRVVAGAQLLTKPLPLVPFFGNIAYCARGPLVAKEEDPQLHAWLMGGIRHFCRRDRVQLLIVQPPAGDPSFEDQLVADGCMVSPVPVAPEATVLVDLSPDLDAIEQQLGKSLRNQLRRAVRKGVEVRRGSRADLRTFHALLTAASARLDYAIFPQSYYEQLWDLFGATDQVQLFIAEHDGRPLSAQLCLIFGDTIFALALGWSGERGNLSPNDLLDWNTIVYGKERGLRFFDLENLSLDVARRISEGARPADLVLKGSDRYKLKWSSKVIVFPRPYLYVAHPAARAGFRRLPPDKLRVGSKTLTTRFRPMVNP